MAIETKDIYKIAAHHRFQWEKAQDCYVILFPEGMVKLNGSHLFKRRTQPLGINRGRH